MGIEKLISIAVALAILTVSTGQLPHVLHAVRVAQLQLIKESQASRWGAPMLLPGSDSHSP
jgi:hypothetical protein